MDVTVMYVISAIATWCLASKIRLQTQFFLVQFKFSFYRGIFGIILCVIEDAYNEARDQLEKHSEHPTLKDINKIAFML